MTTGRNQFRYQPYYCEKNIWWLCQDKRFMAAEALVLVISNASRRCLFWSQRSGDPILWDYHVVFAERTNAQWLLWDLDTRLEFPGNAESHLSATFR